MKKLNKIEEKENLINQLKFDLISRFHPLSNKEVIKYKSVLNFDGYALMNNEHINWDIELIKLVKDKIVSSAFWKLKNIKFDLTFFDEFNDIIDYSSIHISKNIKWSKKLIDNYGVKFDWSNYLINQEGLCTIENIRRFKDILDWSKVSETLNLPISDEMIVEFKDYWIWSKLSLNKNLPISLEFLEKYKDLLDFDNLSKNPSCLPFILKYAKSKRWNWNNVIINPGLEYNDKTFRLVFRYYSKQNLHIHQINSINFKSILPLFLKRVFWAPFTIKTYFLKDLFIEHFPWDIVSKSNIVVNKEFINTYKENINFKENEFLKNNKNIIDSDFISNNIELFNLKSYSFYTLNLDNSIIEKSINDIDWINLSSCENIDWSWDFISNNLEKLHLCRLSENKKAYNDLIKNRLSNEDIFSFLDNCKN